jgi:ribosomal-protein-alanine N-acetyltransferase
VKLTPATPAQAPAIAALAGEAGVQGWSVAGVSELLASPLGHAWVTEAASGFVLTRWVADEAELLLIAVHASRRQQGLGRALYEAFERAARAAGIRVVHLEVAEDNAPARALYAQLGFALVGRRPKYYAGRVDALLLSKELRGTTVV